jgi:hypothetical protein
MHDRQRTPIERSLEVKVRAKLLRAERLHRKGQSPASQQVRPAALELPRRRAAQGEAPAPVLDQAVHLAKQRGVLLNLVQNDPARLAGLSDQSL